MRPILKHASLAVSLVCVVALALATTATFTARAAHTAAASGSIPEDGHIVPALTHLIPPGNSAFRASGFQTTRAVPYWSSSFAADGTTYPFSMMGADPAADSTTTVPTVVVPLKFVFSPNSNLGGGNFSDVRDPYTVDPDFGLTGVQGVVDSPIFQTAVYPDGVGNVQWGDAVMRATFDKTGASGYHVLLSTPTILPEVTITVPENQAEVHSISGRIEFTWLNDRLKELLNTLPLDPHTLVIFTAYNILFYVKDPSNCCGEGFHSVQQANNINLNGNTEGNGNQPVQTYIFAPWFTSDLFGIPGFGDTLTLSHEVSETLNDPFAFNIVPPWTYVGLTPPICGSDLLETGDPLEILDSASFAVPLDGHTFHVQDEVLLPWFTHQSPSAAAAGAYSYPDTTLAPTFPPSC